MLNLPIDRLEKDMQTGLDDTQSLRQKILNIERCYVVDGDIWALSTGFEVIDRNLPDKGLPSHCVHEITGAQALGFTIKLLAQLHQGRGCLWCRMATNEAYPYGPALADKGVNLEHVHFVQCESHKDLLWAMEEGLRSGAVSIVIGEPQGHLNLTSCRRLQLAAEAGGNMGLVLNSDHKVNLAHNALFSRWRITPSPTSLSEKFAWDVALLRMRGVKPMDWRAAEMGFHD